MEMFFGIFAAGCGIYCLYGYYLARFKKQAAARILLPKDVDVKNCKDLEGYCRETSRPLLILGIVTTLYGASDIYNTKAGGAGTLFLVMMCALFITVIVFVMKVRKINKKYFEIGRASCRERV